MTSETERVFNEIVESFVERYRRGERPSLSEYAQQHPQYADRIVEFFPSLVMMEELAPGEENSIPPTMGTSADLESLDDYQILREVGRGGMGVVYEAKQESLGRHVALKVLPFHGFSDSNHLKRFQREARAAARLHHTNIVPVFEVGEHSGIHYYAMQFIRGQGLDEVFSDLKSLRETAGATSKTPRAERPAESRGTRDSARDTHSSSANIPKQSALSDSTTSDEHYFRSIARIGTQAADALAYAHEQGILHRDVKPSNLMLDTEGKVWVMDFGLAKTDAKEALTHTGDLVGTLRYMAPERFDGWSDARSDVYGLGLTLYEMLTLRSAFDESDRARLIKRITHDELPHPRRSDPNVPVDLETIVLKAIAREPRERYQSADQLAEDLRRFLSKEPIKARRTSLGERARMWCRRNPLVAGLTAALVVFLLVGTGIATWAAIHFEQLAKDRQKTLESKEILVDQLTAAKRIAIQRLEGSGRYHFDRDENEQAVQDFTALLETDPNNGEYLWWRAQAYGRLDRLEKATQDISRFIEIYPNSVEAYSARAGWQWQTPSRSHRKSAADYRAALKIDPNNPTFLNNLAWHEAMSPSDVRDLDLALESSQKALTASPRKWTYNITRGIVHYRRGEFEQAIEILKKTRMRNDSYACCFLGMSHQQLGDLDHALRYYRLAADQWLTEKKLYRIRERIRYASEAIELIGTYLENHPDHFELLFRRATLRFRVRKLKEAIEDATRMIELRPELNDGYFWRGRAYMSLRQDELAIRDFEKSLSIKPGDFWCYRNLAWLYVLGPEHVCDLEKAQQALGDAGKPDHVLVKEVLCLVHYRRGELNKAVQVARSVADPRDHGVVQCVLAMCYHKLGRFEDARKHLKWIDEAWGPIAHLDSFWDSVRRTLKAEAVKLVTSK